MSYTKGKKTARGEKIESIAAVFGIVIE